MMGTLKLQIKTLMIQNQVSQIPRIQQKMAAMNSRANIDQKKLINPVRLF